MQHRYVVLDQNVLRKNELTQLIADQATTKFVLPDLSFLEMTKTPQWESTLKNSLVQLASIPQCVVVAYSVNEALGQELDTLKPVNGRMLSIEATQFVRNILSWVKTGANNSSIQRMRDDPDRHLPDLAVDHLDHEKNKRQLEELIQATKQFIPEELQRRMRGSSLSEMSRLDIVHDIAKGLAPWVLVNKGLDVHKSRAFIKQRPLFYRYIIVRVWYCTEWISKGGFESFSEEQVTNEILDHQYVLTASFFHDLLSLDAKANRAYQALRSILSREI